MPGSRSNAETKPDNGNVGFCFSNSLRSVVCLILAALIPALAACAPPLSAETTSATAPVPDPTDYVATLIARAITGTAKARLGNSEVPTITDPSGATSSGTHSLPPPGVLVSTPTRINLPTPPPIPSPSPTILPCPANGACLEGQHLWLARPIAPEYVDYVDPTYRYGETQNGIRPPHHGVEFQNPAGTPVLACAPGTVVAAGNDWKNVYGPSLFFYGSLVVLELDQKLLNEPVYLLYGHLSEVSVQVGQKVASGNMLGRVGASGVALGPHLHFEVRVGANNYSSTRNPELWLRPLLYNDLPWGVLAGRVLDEQGRPLPAVSVAIRSVDVDYPAPVNRYAVTYPEAGLNGDEVLLENFALGDLPIGTYEVSVNTTTLYRQVVTIHPGRVTLVQFEVHSPPPASSTPTP